MTTKKFKFSNGDTVKEKVTGFEGIITGTAFYLTGCSQYCVVGKSKDNAEAPALWFDEGRLELKHKGTIKDSDVQTEENGCDIAPPFGKRSM